MEASSKVISLSDGSSCFGGSAEWHTAIEALRAALASNSPVVGEDAPYAQCRDLGERFKGCENVAKPAPTDTADRREAKEALRRWHRDTCYPDASDGELEIGLNAIASLIAEPATSASLGEDRREAIARIIYPKAGECAHNVANGIESWIERKDCRYDYWQNAWSMWAKTDWDRALAKADAILALIAPASISSPGGDRREAIIDAIDGKVGGAFHGATGRLVATEIYDAIASLIAGPLPEGFVAVPVEPTEAMIFAGDDAAAGSQDLGDGLTRAIWSAMIAAATGDA